METNIFFKKLILYCLISDIYLLGFFSSLVFGYLYLSYQAKTLCLGLRIHSHIQASCGQMRQSQTPFSLSSIIYQIVKNVGKCCLIFLQCQELSLVAR